MENFNLIDLLNQISFSPNYIRVFGAFLVSFTITIISIPKIIRVSYKKQLMDEPGYRSSHVKKVPTLGGVAIYFAIIVSSTIFAFELSETYKFFYASVVILFFIGLMDDLLVVAPSKKLYAQFISASLIIFGSNVRISNLFGLFGIHELPYIISVLLSLFVFIVIINSYNLIDGIDGLASSVGMVISFSFIYIFFKLWSYSLGILSVAVFASLLAFLRFNLSSKQKIFMGDTGSMVIGFVLSFMMISFLNITGGSQVNLKASTALCLAIFIVPILDTAMVFSIRIAQKKSPFYPDKNHIHHQFLKLGLSHIQASVCIAIFNILIIVLAFCLRHFEINFAFLIILSVSVFCLLLLKLMVHNSTKKALSKN